MKLIQIRFTNPLCLDLMCVLVSEHTFCYSALLTQWQFIFVKAFHECNLLT